MLRTTKKERINTRIFKAVHGKNLIPILILQSHKDIVPRDGGVIDQNIDVAHCSFGSGNEIFHIFPVGEIAAHHMTLTLAAEAPPGAASCSGCHAERPDVDTPVPRLAGQDASAVAAAMRAYRNGQRPATVMDRIAKGFSDDEITAIASWFAMHR